MAEPFASGRFLRGAGRPAGAAAGIVAGPDEDRAEQRQTRHRGTTRRPPSSFASTTATWRSTTIRPSGLCAASLSTSCSLVKKNG